MAQNTLRLGNHSRDVAQTRGPTRCLVMVSQISTSSARKYDNVSGSRVSSKELQTKRSADCLSGITRFYRSRSRSSTLIPTNFGRRSTLVRKGPIKEYKPLSRCNCRDSSPHSTAIRNLQKWGRWRRRSRSTALCNDQLVAFSRNRTNTSHCRTGARGNQTSDNHVFL